MICLDIAVVKKNTKNEEETRERTEGKKQTSFQVFILWNQLSKLWNFKSSLFILFFYAVRTSQASESFSFFVYFSFVISLPRLSASGNFSFKWKKIGAIKISLWFIGSFTMMMKIEKLILHRFFLKLTQIWVENFLMNFKCALSYAKYFL